MESNGEFKTFDLDPYKNPFLSTPLGCFNEKKCYNEQMKAYKKGLLIRRERCLWSKELKDRYKLVQLVLANKGSAQCGKMKVKLSFSSNSVYSGNLLETKTETCEGKPQLLHSANIIYTPGLFTEQYDYLEINNLVPLK